MWEELFSPSNALSVAGLAGTLASWLDSRKSRFKDQTITDYLEWLRRRNHKELVSLISQESADNLVRIESLIRSLNDKTVEHLQQTAQAIREGNLQQLAELQRISRLFSSAQVQSLSPEVLNFERQYLASLSKQFGKLRMIAIREMRDVEQDLSIAYVSLRVTSHINELSEPESSEAVVRREKLLTIRGLAGSGKTTLLSWIAMQSAAGANEEQENVWQGAGRNKAGRHLPSQQLGMSGVLKLFNSKVVGTLRVP